MAHPSFPSKGLKEKKTDVPQEPWHPMDQALFVLALA